jgi:hypothetical protein
MDEKQAQHDDYPRQIGWFLTFGIILFPLIFGWFVFRRGHSIYQRIPVLAWMSFSFLIFLLFRFLLFRETESESQPVANYDHGSELGIGCPTGYSSTGRKGCYKIDRISREIDRYYNVYGKLIIHQSYNTVILDLLAKNSNGDVICSGNASISDVTGEQFEPWNGMLSDCTQEPTDIAVKVADGF